MSREWSNGWTHRRRRFPVVKLILVVLICVLILGVFLLLIYYLIDSKNSKAQGAFASGTSVAENNSEQPDGSEQFTDSEKPSEAAPIVIELPEEHKVDFYVPEHEGIPLILIDPGHGGYDVGANAGSCLEKDINLAIALKTRDQLNRMGYVCVVTREDDSHLYLSDRTNIANDIKADVCVSIHQNFFDQTDITGTETWYGSEDSRDLATFIHKKVVEHAQSKSRSVQEGDYHMVRETMMPSCLIEVGFLSNPEERNNLLSSEYQEKIATGIAEGIDEYLKQSQSNKNS